MIQAGTGADSPMTCGGSGVTGPVWAGDPERSCLLVRGREGQIVVEETADHAPDHRFELRGRVHIVEAEELGIATRGQGVELLPRVGMRDVDVPQPEVAGHGPAGEHGVEIGRASWRD